MDKDVQEIFDNIRDVVAVHQDDVAKMGQHVAEAKQIPNQIQAELSAVNRNIHILEAATLKAEEAGQRIFQLLTSKPQITHDTAKMWVGASLVAALVFLAAGTVIGWQYAQDKVKDSVIAYTDALSKLPEDAQWAATKEGKLAFRVWPKSLAKWNLSSISDSDIAGRLYWAFTAEGLNAYNRTTKK